MKNSFYNIIVQIKNGQLNKTLFILCKKTNDSKKILNILWENGLILGYCLHLNIQYKIFLKYYKNKPSINSIKKLIYNEKLFLTIKQLWKIKNNNIILICSTNQGIKVLSDCKSLNIGGKALLLIN